MKSDQIGKHVIIAFGLAVGFYLASFTLIEHLRQRKGPWDVRFLTDSKGRPSLIVSQPTLAISNVQFSFPDVRLNQTNLGRTIMFDAPITNIPFGSVIFLDTTFLPGTVTMDLFGHEIELLPRVLVLNRKEIAWQSGATFELFDKDRPAARSERGGSRKSKPAGER